MTSLLAPDRPDPVTVRLKLGQALVVIGAHAVLCVLQILFDGWIALTPGRDRNVASSKNNARRYE